MTTINEFKSRAEQAFLKANPSAVITGWIEARRVVYPTGVKGIVGKFHAIAEGHRPAIMRADLDDSGLMVR